MATLHLTIFKSKVLANGKHKIRIAVSHKSVTKYIVTRYIIDKPEQLQNGRVVRRADANLLNSKLQALLAVYQERLDNIANPSAYDCRQIKLILMRGDKEDATPEPTWQQVCQEYAEELRSQKRNTYADLLDYTSRLFTEYTHGTMLLQDITPDLIEAYHHHIATKNRWSISTISLHLRNIKTVVNRAIKQRKVAYTIHPFVNTPIKKAPVRESDISIDTITRIINYHSDSTRLQIARDMFLLSFYMGGMNLIDILSVPFPPQASSVKFTRRKINSRMPSSLITSLPVNPKAREIIDKYMDPKTHLVKLPYKFKSQKNISRHILRALHEIEQELNLPEHIMFYSARKTFAQFAADLGIPDNVIDYCLGHSDTSRGTIRYYTKVRARQAEIAVNRVVDYSQKPDKYQDLIEMRLNMAAFQMMQ